MWGDVDMNVNMENKFTKFLLARLKHYDHDKYWKMRAEVVNPNSKKSKLLRYYYLYRIKRSDAFNNASMGTDMGHGAQFATPPILLHGLNGIIISHDAKIGRNVSILQQVTISQGGVDTSATIGDNCMIGAGAKIIGEVTIGDNVMIGANAVVTHDIPSNCVAGGVPARVIKYHAPSEESPEGRE